MFGRGRAVANIQRVQRRLHQLSGLAAPRATQPRCFGCKGCRLQAGVYLQNPPLLQTAGCHSPYSPPHPDQDCMRALTHGECDQLKLCWARIPGVGGGWQRHDRNGFRGRGGGEGSHPTPSLLVSWVWHRFRGPHYGAFCSDISGPGFPEPCDYRARVRGRRLLAPPGRPL